MTKLKVGDVIELDKKHRVYANVPEHFVYANRRGIFDKLTHTEIDLAWNDFDFLRGKYIVTKAKMDGGGTGHGPGDVYPDGWHVYCISVDGKHMVDFYQSGCFTVVIEDIEPIGKATQTWTVE